MNFDCNVQLSKSDCALFPLLTSMQALLPHHPLATFHGLDIATAQVTRFNNEATKILGEHDGKDRMLAVQGDLLAPTPSLTGADWSDFDVAIISMALHHIIDPIALLDKLKQRVRKGGVIVVVDWLVDDDKEKGEVGEKYDESKMKKLEHGPKIWNGFSEKGIENDMKAAGCEMIEIKIFPVETEAPEFMRGYDRMFIAKGVAV